MRKIISSLWLVSLGLILLVSLILVGAGCGKKGGEKEEPLGPSGEPSGTPSAQFSPCHDAEVDEVVCSNENYAVTKAVANSGIYPNGICVLDTESQKKFFNAIKEQGDIVLEGISDLVCITRLFFMELSACDKISDISSLSNLTNLEELILNYTEISDISPLSNLTNLKQLSLQGTKISDISPLSNLTNLKQLSLQDTKISDISPLSNLTKLYNLSLSETKVSDVSHLSNLTNLKILDLSKTEVSDVSPLSNLTKLIGLDLIRTKVSGKDCKELKQKLGEEVVDCSTK